MCQIADIEVAVVQGYTKEAQYVPGLDKNQILTTTLKVNSPQGQVSQMRIISITGPPLSSRVTGGLWTRCAGPASVTPRGQALGIRSSVTTSS